MIARRGLLARGTALAAVSPIGVTALPVPPDLRFDVLRNGSRIGQHNVRFRQDGTALEAAIDVNIAVRLGPIVLYRYTHLVRETWRDGGFQSLESETNDDGVRQWVRATRTPESVIVEASETPRAIEPPNAIPLTHWNNLCMERPLFNPQDGALIASRILTRGEDMVPLADGRAVRATRYSLIGKVALDDWYDVTRLWTALRAQGRDGSTIEYRRAA
jgi:Family of unknown function (DUF6134)